MTKSKKVKQKKRSLFKEVKQGIQEVNDGISLKTISHPKTNTLLDDLSIQHFNQMCLSNIFVLILGLVLGYFIGNTI